MECLCLLMKDSLHVIEKAITTRLHLDCASVGGVVGVDANRPHDTPSQDAILAESSKDKGKQVLDPDVGDQEKDTTIMVGASDEDNQHLTPAISLTTEEPVSWNDYVASLEDPNVKVINLDD